MLSVIPAIPLLGFLLLSLAGKRMPKTLVALTGAGTVCISALLTIAMAIRYMLSPPANGYFQEIVWQWFRAGNLSIQFSLSADALTIVFLFIITFVGALIHIYSTAFMREDHDYARFFACMNLFVCSMLLLVLADNLVLLYLGWEGVGLCSYLLIGFWFREPINNRAANKAFLVTRIGDTAMLIGLFILFRDLGTLDIRAIRDLAPDYYRYGSEAVTLVAILLLAGGIGKSAQVPLQTWLPDAMAGPSPVSALIHAATMVTAGVYLVARMNAIFTLSPLAMAIVAIVGAVTLLLAGCSALVQSDIKRVLAYSTISQIGYMFLALGVGAWSSAIFHFFTHAFFKALLFLAAGVVIESLHHEHNIFRMGGLRKSMPMVFLCFLAGAAALAAVPLVSAGFFSKDPILWYAYAAKNGNAVLWMTALAGAFLTAFYTTRLMLLVFWGEQRTHMGHLPGRTMVLPLVILAVLSIIAGFIEWPHNMLHVTVFSDFLEPVLPATQLKPDLPSEFIFQLIAALTTFSGIYVGYMLYYRKTYLPGSWKQSPAVSGLWQLLYKGWGFDQLYNFLFVKPFLFITRTNKKDFIDTLYNALGALNLQLNQLLSRSQNGSLRWYVMGVLFGIIFIITLQLLL